MQAAVRKKWLCFIFILCLSFSGYYQGDSPLTGVPFNENTPASEGCLHSFSKSIKTSHHDICTAEIIEGRFATFMATRHPAGQKNLRVTGRLLLSVLFTNPFQILFWRSFAAGGLTASFTISSFIIIKYIHSQDGEKSIPYCFERQF